LRRIGVSFDWDREYFTMDDVRSKGVKECFYRLFQKGLIYRASRLINWSCSLRTAISNIEVEKREVKAFEKLTVPGYAKPIEFGVLIEFAYKVKDMDAEIIVSTTRLETMLGDVAVAVNSKDDRYKHLVGKKLIHPFVDRELEVIVDDELVDMTFGTGAVKITPAHDPNDFACAKRKNLQFINIMNDDGTMNDLCGKYKGMKRYDVREAMLKDM
jgi:valyl-tRNA synthetase